MCDSREQSFLEKYVAVAVALFRIAHIRMEVPRMSRVEFHNTIVAHKFDELVTASDIRVEWMPVVNRLCRRPPNNQTSNLRSVRKLYNIIVSDNR